MSTQKIVYSSIIHNNVYSSSIHDSQKMVITQMSINKSIDKQKVLYAYDMILSNHKRNEVLIHVTAWMNLENIMLSEKRQSQKAMYYMIPFT